MLNNSGESGHPCLVPDLGGNAFNFSPLRMMFAVGLSCMSFIMLRYVPSMPTFTNIIQGSCGSPSYTKQKRKRNKKNPDQKRKNKALTAF